MSCWSFVERVMESSKKFGRTTEIILCTSPLFFLQTSSLVINRNLNISCGLYYPPDGMTNATKTIGILKGLGCNYILVGDVGSRIWSWRDQDNIVAQIKLMVECSIIPILFVSESRAEKELCGVGSGVVTQLRFLKASLSNEMLRKLILVYRPIGFKESCSPSSAGKVHEIFISTIGLNDITILYGTAPLPQKAPEILGRGYEGFFFSTSHWISFSSRSFGLFN